MLEAVGVTTSEESVYRMLLDHPHATLAELATLAGLSVGQARRAISGLVETGLVARRPGSPAHFAPARPDVAVEAMILRRQEELERTRLQAARLLEQFQRTLRRNGDRQVVETITGREAILQRSTQLVASAREEILMFDKPPYLTPLDDPIQYEALGRGVRWRAVYAPESLHVPDRLADLHRLAAAGEQARIASRLPLKLAITDRRLALLPLTTDADSADRTAIVVAPCSLLDTVIMLFEMVWGQSVPVPADTTEAADVIDRSAAGTGIGHAERELLALLAAGSKDEVIARQLELSVRTVRRRIAALIQEQGVHTRFQLGLIAARRGWI